MLTNITLNFHNIIVYALYLYEHLLWIKLLSAFSIIYTFFSWLLFIRDAHTDRQTNRQDVLRDLWKFAIVMIFNQMHLFDKLHERISLQNFHFNILVTSGGSGISQQRRGR